MSTTIAELNGQPREQFVETVGWVFEHSPWVAERAWKKRPFVSFDDLSTKLIQEVQSSSPNEQLALLQAHPDLGTKATVSESSSAEQAEAGLDRLTQSEYDELKQLNEKYKKKFGFPFLFAVKGSDKKTILDALKRRLNSAPEQEFQVALGHVFRIARFRLEDTIQ
jgi:2-oxo-4-hydroxy-4-carboxy-5-ureidoimidazoline decarboxylase